eukprot:sb/3477631/
MFRLLCISLLLFVCTQAWTTGSPPVYSTTTYINPECSCHSECRPEHSTERDHLREAFCDPYGTGCPIYSECQLASSHSRSLFSHNYHRFCVTARQLTLRIYGTPCI